MLKQNLYTYITKFAAWLKRNRRIQPGTTPVKINVGSSLAVYRDWLNIDVGFNIFLAKFPVSILKYYYRKSGAKSWWTEEEFIGKLKNHTFYHHRIEYGLPFDDGAVDFVYSSHTFEHLFKKDAIFFLNESMRVLKPGGILRLCIPDLKYALKLYYNGKKEESMELFFPNSKSDYTSRHLYMYDFEMLSELLDKAGFVEIKECGYQKGETPDIEFLDVRPEATLFVEAKKPEKQ